MIIHRHQDGSEGYEYQLGDQVEIIDVIPRGDWFRRAIGRVGPIVGFDKRSPRRWQIDPVYVRDAPDWGPSHCMPWQVKPTAATIAAASIEQVEGITKGQAE